MSDDKMFSFVVGLVVIMATVAIIFAAICVHTQHQCMSHGYSGYDVEWGESFCIRRIRGTDFVVKLSELN